MRLSKSIVVEIQLQNLLRAISFSDEYTDKEKIYLLKTIKDIFENIDKV